MGNKLFVLVEEINKATAQQDVKTVQTLLSDVKDLLKADRSIVNEKNELQRTPILEATIEKNLNIELVTLLIDAGADVNATTKSGQTPLILAAQNGHDKVVELLLGAGANVKAVNTRGASALFMAAQEGHDKAVKLLLKKGADAKTVNANGTSALFMAVKKGYHEVVKLLLEKGVDVTDTNVAGTYSILGTVIRYKHIKVVKVLIESKNLGIFGKGDDFERSLKDNHLLLALKNDLEITKLLLKELSFPSYQIKEAQDSELDIHNLLNAVKGTNLESVTFKNFSNQNASLDSIASASSDEIEGKYSNWNDEDDVNNIGHTTHYDTFF